MSSDGYDALRKNEKSMVSLVLEAAETTTGQSPEWLRLRIADVANACSSTVLDAWLALTRSLLDSSGTIGFCPEPMVISLLFLVRVTWGT